MRKRIVRVAIGLACAAAFGWLTLRSTSLAAVGSVLVEVKAGWVALGMGAFCAGYALRVQRWRAMLVIANPALRWRDCAGPLIASFAVNNVLPLRAGDLMRSFAFERNLRVGPGVVIATLVVERVLDLAMVVLVLALGLIFAGHGIELIGAAGAVVAVGTLAVLTLIAAFPGTAVALLRGTSRWVHARAPWLGGRFLNEVESALGTVAALSSRGRIVELVGWSGGAWLAEAVLYLCVAVGMPAISRESGAWLSLALGNFATILPTAPGYVGTFDYFAARAMVIAGNEAAAATAYALLVHFLLWLPPTLVGGAYLISRTFRAPAPVTT